MMSKQVLLTLTTALLVACSEPTSSGGRVGDFSFFARAEFQPDSIVKFACRMQLNFDEIDGPTSGVGRGSVQFSAHLDPDLSLAVADTFVTDQRIEILSLNDDSTVVVLSGLVEDTLRGVRTTDRQLAGEWICPMSFPFRSLPVFSELGLPDSAAMIGFWDITR